MAEKINPHSYQAWAEAFAIFARYDLAGGNVAVGREEVFAGSDPANVTAADRERLEQLGWHSDEQHGCFYHFA